jgi:hypothetical protein
MPTIYNLGFSLLSTLLGLFILLASHLLLVDVCGAFSCLTLSGLHAHHCALLSSLCSVQDLSLCVCPAWSSFRYFVPEIMLVYC